MKKKISASLRAWERYSKDRKFYFEYLGDRPNTWKLLDTGAYGVVQLVCIDRAVRAAFMRGFIAGKRTSKSTGEQ